MPLQRVLVTGGAGFLGSHLTQSFRNQGVTVRVFDLAQRPDWARVQDVDYVRGDVRDGEALGTALAGVDAVIHAAFASPRQAPTVIESVNVDGVLETCRQALAHGVLRFVLISSTIVDKPPRAHPFLRNAPLTRLDVYRKSRIEAERVATEQRSGGLRVGIVRPKTFVGPGRVSAFAIVFDWIRLGKPVLLLGKARSRYQLLEIRDMAEGIRLLAGSNAEGVFWFGALNFGTIREDLQALLNYAQTGARLRFVPEIVARIGLRGMELAGVVPPSEWHYMSAWSRDSVVDISRAVEELGWHPRWSNAEALRNAYDWYVERIRISGTGQSTHPLPASHRTFRKLIETLLP
jgi:nucleoside-diphosphate-sugar epimerase